MSRFLAQLPLTLLTLRSAPGTLNTAELPDTSTGAITWRAARVTLRAPAAMTSPWTRRCWS